ncbi:hypothetical protein BABINDRAFT_158954 [Babjeviella inositovora NRRL Y-12698]|uniref:RING-type domain-containing protein n=1 Tax=Babjeviella inositovora NRRL Y-12698 TaxID=984486 RepID=A0A1E3QXR2_9ASCO|nr:uncharacterized protein BABINDRAFT_158954 [Babjeviella inositovora NRRL Y-12698]ODQ82334.1 hypothetical protein BABINDRAFT_158954 [Babjeviella inositovora NRRL Y-12698]
MEVLNIFTITAAGAHSGPSSITATPSHLSSPHSTAVTLTSLASSSVPTSLLSGLSSFVLFYIALAAGISVAVLFIFCTIRYFVRSRFGLNVTPSVFTSSVIDPFSLTRLPFILSGPRSGGFTGQEIHVARVRRWRRARYRAKRRLNAAEVEKLFPQKTYHDWLNGGKERDILQRDGQLKEVARDGDGLGEEFSIHEGTSSHASLPDIFTNLSSESIYMSNANVSTAALPGEGIGKPEPAKSSSNVAFVPSATQSHERGVVERVDDNPESNSTERGSYKKDTYTIEMAEISRPETGSSLQQTQVPEPAILTAKNIIEQAQEAHFTSGTCAICLELLEDEEIVRGLICGHVFHQECLDPWLIDRNACCPMCKRSYYYKNEQENSATGDGGDPQGDEEGNADHDDDVDSLYSPFTPISARVPDILRNEANSHMDLKEFADREVARLYNIKFIFFWKLMGVSKSDIFNWAVLKRFEELTLEERRQSREVGTQPGGQPAEETSINDHSSALGTAPPSLHSHADPTSTETRYISTQANGDALQVMDRPENSADQGITADSGSDTGQQRPPEAETTPSFRSIQADEVENRRDAVERMV